MRTLVVFTEETSAKVMLQSLMPRLLPEGIQFICIEFEGKQDLEKQLPIKLRGWRAPNTLFVILRDQDSGDCHVIKAKLMEICAAANKPNALVRIACRELESWYLADLAAVENALSIEGVSEHQARARYRKPDEIVGPATALMELTRNRYQKVSGSRLIGRHLDLGNTRSRSFHNFIDGVRRLVANDA